MKRFKNMSFLLIISSLALMLSLNMSGCSKQFSPTAPDSDDITDQGKLHFISLNTGNNSLTKTTALEVRDYVTYKDGGELIVDYKDETEKTEVKTTLKVFSETISEDSWLTLRMDESFVSGAVDVEFGPHGVIFSRPALLNIEVKKSDLSNIDKMSLANLNMYYINYKTNCWEKMQTKEIIVDKDNGYLKIIDAEIPHFSKYALAYSE